MNFQIEIKEKEEILDIANVSTIILQVNGQGSVSVKGSIDDSDFIPLSGIDANFNIVNTISTTGLYSYDTSGISQLKIVKSIPELKVVLVGVE